MAEYVVYTSDDWSGLYINGRLDIYGDSYLIEERLHDIFGVVDIMENVWLDENERPIPTITQINKRIENKRKAQVKAEELRAEAQRLLDEADIIESE